MLRSWSSRFIHSGGFPDGASIRRSSHHWVQLELHLSTGDDDVERATRLLDAATAELADVLGDGLVSTHGESLEVVVGRLLTSGGQRVALAESCTGGLATSRLTDVPGSSAYVLAGWVVYSNEAKVELGVDAALIARHGAVSEPVASALAVQGVPACGCRLRARIDRHCRPGWRNTRESRSGPCGLASPGSTGRPERSRPGSLASAIA